MHPGFPFGPVAIAEKLILSIAAPLALFFLSGLPKVSRKSPQSHLICITALWSLVITLNPFLNHGLGWDGTVTRLNGLSYVQIAILLPGLIWLSTLVQKDSWLYLVALFTPFFVLSVSASLPTGMQAAYLHNRSQIIEEFPKQIPNIVPGALIIAEQGTQFVVTFASGLPAQNLLPRSESSRLDIYWVLFGVKPHMLGEPMTKLAIGDRGTFTVLIRNEELKKYLSLLADGDRRYLFAVNSHLYQTCINANLSTLLGECTQLP